MLGAIAQATSRARLGHMVVCTGFRNPALTAKMASTLDVISGGRFELGIGAGWKEDEWIAYGYPFPSLRERLAVLADHLEIIRRMLGPGRASYEGRYARVDGAINVPKGVQQPRIPVIVGGNGQNVTFRLAARFADELNLVFLDPAGVGEHMAIARQRCEEEGRDPATLRISLYCRDGDVRPVGQERVDRLGAFAALGLNRLVAFPSRWDTSGDGLAHFAEDVRAAGLPRCAAERELRASAVRVNAGRRSPAAGRTPSAAAGRSSRGGAVAEPGPGDQVVARRSGP